MGQQMLQTIIALSGRTDNSFGKIGNELLILGNHIDALSQKVIDFGKESVEDYINYDDVMREVQALGEYDDKTMRTLNEYNKTIAQTSKFTMEQAAQAEVMMAQLGLNMDQTKTLMPTVMNLATAANIDLSDSLDYLYYSLNALDLPMEYANTLSDQMAKTAAISAADIDTLGQSLQRLGSGAQFFAGGSGEILAILGGISQFGKDMQGRDAGTQLRNFMLTLLAPTKGKADIMSTLGVTEKEWSEFETYMEDAGINVTDTAAAMNELGLTVYDSATGKLKPAIQIIAELDAALSSMTGEEKNEVLGNLFGKRTTTTALNLLESLPLIIEYQKQIEDGSAGYTEEMADTMEGGLGGQIRRLTAAWDAFKVSVGENVSEDVGGVAEFLTDVSNALTNMDETQLSALVGGLEGIAAAGPALLLAGGAIKLISYATTPMGQLALGATLAAAGIGALVKGISAWNEATHEANFGDMELDQTSLISHVNAIGDAFNDSYTDVNNYANALDTAVKNYQTASTTMSSDLLTAMIAGATLTPEQIKGIEGLGQTMGAELLKGINASFDKSASYLNMLFGENAANDPDYQNAITVAGDMYDSLIGQAEELGRQFGETLGSAMDDGIITGEEYSAIMEKMQAYNDAMAVAAQADQAAEMAQSMHKAQSASWDSAAGFLAEQNGIMNTNIEEAEMLHIGERAKWGVYFDEAIAKGQINPVTGKAYSDADKTAFLADMDARYDAKIRGYKDQNAQVTMAVFDALVGQSDFGAALPFLEMALGNIDTMERDFYSGALTLNDVDWAALDAAGMLPENIVDQIFGFYDASKKLEELFEPYADNPEVAKLMEQMGYLFALGEEAQSYQFRKENYEESGGTVDPRGEFTTPEQLAYNQRKAELETNITNTQTELDRLRDQDAKISAEITERENRLAGYDVPWHYYLTNGRAEDESMLYGNVLGGNLTEKKEKVTLDIEEAERQLAAWRLELAAMTVPIAIEPVQEGGDPLAQLEEQGVEVDVEGDTTELTATIDAEDGKTLLEYVSGDATALSLTIKGEDGKTLVENVTGDASDLAAIIDNYNGRTITVNIKGQKMFAEGGRATTASIFGEAGPEWAIPEEHSQRTAQLFDMARAASGFTWPELIARNGGLNAGGGTPTTLVYSPTIIANDASGVEDKLAEDKERLDNWWREKQMRDEAEVYA